MRSDNIQPHVKHALQCSQVWGGIRDVDVDACSAALTASLISHACDGGKGGDIYYFSVCDGDLLTRVVLADVVGHGQRVSGVSEWLYDAMHRQMNSLEGNEILTQLNGIAVERGISALTTAAVAGFYREDSNFYFSYAGHHPALILRRGETRWHDAMLTHGGADFANLPLGVERDVIYDQGRLQLRRGDRIAMYTDGLIEAPDRAGNLFGIDRLRKTLDRVSRDELFEMKREVLDAVRMHAGPALSHDDVTMILTEVN